MYATDELHTEEEEASDAMLERVILYVPNGTHPRDWALGNKTDG